MSFHNNSVFYTAGCGNSSNSTNETCASLFNIIMNASTGLDNTTDHTNPRMVTGVVVLGLLILNLLGNSVVLYIYSFKIKASVFSFYVTVLSSLDIITALTTMLIDVIIKVRPLDENVLHLTCMCKITHFQVYSQSLISGCVLTLIAYQRYTKICHPLDPGFKLRTAKLALTFIVIVCVLISIVTLVINGPQDVDVEVSNRVVKVTICRYDKNYEGTNFQTAFSIFLTSAFALVLSLTVIFYAMVARSLKKFERQNSLLSKAQISPNIDMTNKDKTAKQVLRRLSHHLQRNLHSSVSNTSTNEGQERISTQMYKVFATITAIFIVSYLPHLVVLILTKTLRLDYQVLTFTKRTLLDLAYNCPYISTVANPVVYGFRSAEFRKRLKHNIYCRG